MVPTLSEFTCEGVGFYPHPASCSEFYRCTDLWATGQFQQYLFQCPAGTAWDPEIGVCNWPAEVEGCGAEEAVSSSSTPSQTTVTATSTSSPPTPPITVPLAETTVAPTQAPTEEPTEAQTSEPTAAPTAEPTKLP